MTRGLIGAVVISCCMAAAAMADPFEITLQPAGGAERIFNQPPDHPTPIQLSVSGKSLDHAAHQLNITLNSPEIARRAPGWQDHLALDVAADGKPASQTIDLPALIGYAQVTATAQDGAASAQAWTHFGVVPPPHQGVRPDSFFQSNTAELKTGDDLALLVAIGMKVERSHFMPPIKVPRGDWRKQLPGGQAIPCDFTELDKRWAATKAAGEWILPVVGYSLQGGGVMGRTPLADELNMYGPPYDYVQFVATWQELLQHYPDITTYEFWNEPWIFEWTWAGTPADYRSLQKLWCQMALKVNPKLRIIAGNSEMFVQDNIEPFPDCWQGLLSGISHHPYTDAGSPNYRGGGNTRTIDDFALEARRMHLPYAYETEGGTLYPTPGNSNKPGAGPLSTNNLQNAEKLVEYFVHSALDGMFAGNIQLNLGFGHDQTQANVAYAVMTHFLEDRPVVADVWPSNELIWGGIFANPKSVTDAVKALPRAGELSARWSVPAPGDDNTKVAVIWSLLGKSNDSIDTADTLTLDPAGLRAFNLFGQEIPPQNGKLVLPFGPSPVYVTTDSLDVIQMRDRLAKASISAATPLNMYALSLGDDVSSREQKLTVRVENQLNQPISGQLTLLVGEDHVGAAIMRYTAEAGQVVDVPVSWPGHDPTASNEYRIRLIAQSNAGADVVREQLISVARFVKKTIDVNAGLDQWQGITPVLLDSDQLKHGVDLAQYLLNPRLDQPTGTADKQRIVARVYTAYDDANVYLAAAVNEPALHCSAGEPVVMGQEKKVTLPYRVGMPGGLHYINLDGDAFQFAFGFRDRVPGRGRQMSDPWAWKGAMYDTDYCYVAHVSTEGDQLIRLWGDDNRRCNGYQTELVPGQGPVPGGRVHITRDEAKKLTLYQIAVPRTELKLFDPSAGRCRFAFVLYNDEKLGDNGLSWTEAAGVFDHWSNLDSFPPTWMGQRACQTFFAIDPGK